MMEKVKDQTHHNDLHLFQEKNLGVTAQLSTTDNKDEFSLLLETNPLIEFVEIPPRWKNLHYSQVQNTKNFLIVTYFKMQAICGAIRGALEAINIEYLNAYILYLYGFNI